MVAQEPGDAEAENNGILTPANVVGPGYFKTIGVEVRRGRDFTSADRAGTQTVAIVNQPAPRDRYPHGDGCSRLGVLKLVLGQGMVRVAVGLALGLGVAVIAGRSVAPLLYGVSPTDAVTFAVTSAVLAAVAGIATLIPAHRASTVDPVNVLRRER